MSGLLIRFIFPIVFILSVFGSGYWVGSNHAKSVYSRAAKEQAERAKKDTDHAQAQVDRISKELKDAKDKIDAHRATAGRVLYVKAACPMSANPDHPAGSDGEVYARLDTETARRIIGITTDGDQAIIRLNACQEILSTIRKEYLK